jgi:hypothetical protein
MLMTNRTDALDNLIRAIDEYDAACDFAADPIGEILATDNIFADDDDLATFALAFERCPIHRCDLDGCNDDSYTTFPNNHPGYEMPCPYSNTAERILRLLMIR